MSLTKKRTFTTNPLTLIQNDMKKTKLTTDQGEDHTAGFLLDYHYIKNHYRLIAVDLSRQKKQMLIRMQFSD